jgi:hypothetical protein
MHVQDALQAEPRAVQGQFEDAGDVMHTDRRDVARRCEHHFHGFQGFVGQHFQSFAGLRSVPLGGLSPGGASLIAGADFTAYGHRLIGGRLLLLLLLRNGRLRRRGRRHTHGPCREPFVTCIRDNAEQLFDTMASDRRDDSKLRKVSTDSIDYCLLRMNKCRVRCSVRQLCCSGVLVATNRTFGLATASQIASASVASFLCHFT